MDAFLLPDNPSDIIQFENSGTYKIGAYSFTTYPAFIPNNCDGHTVLAMTITEENSKENLTLSFRMGSGELVRSVHRAGDKILSQRDFKNYPESVAGENECGNYPEEQLVIKFLRSALEMNQKNIDDKQIGVKTTLQVNQNYIIGFLDKNTRRDSAEALRLVR